MRQGARKRRFGVALPEELAEALDELAGASGSDRSSLVGKAVSMLINYGRHQTPLHDCGGVFVVSGLSDESELSKLIDEYHNIIVSYNHVRLRKGCVTLIVVSGLSQDVERLQAQLLKMGSYVKSYYIPLYCGLGSSPSGAS